MPIIIKALFQLAKNWKAILAIATLFVSVGFSTKIAVQQLGDSVSNNSWIIVLIAIVVVIRELIKAYVAIQSKGESSE